MTPVSVLTGIGAVAPNGADTETYWSATLNGVRGIGPITRFDPTRYSVRLAGQVDGFAADELLPGRLLPQTDQVTRLALVAADRALADAGVTPADLPEYSMGVVTANAFGGFEFGHYELEKLWRNGPRHVSAYQSFAWFYAVNTGQISIRNGMRGPSGVLVSEQAGGLDALAQARRHIRKGTALVVSGGLDSALSPWGWTAHLSSGRLSTVDDPAAAYLPFGSAASGHVPGEGGAILIVEDREHAISRGTPRIYAEIAGAAATFDGRAGQRPAGAGLVRAAAAALADAGIRTEQVDVVFADGAGTPDLDRAEAAALVELFGPRGVPVTVPKTLIGRLAAGAGALDVATAALAIRDGVIPAGPDVGLDPAYPLDLVTGAPRDAPVRTALVLARGAGGFNSAVVLTTHRPY